MTERSDFVVSESTKRDDYDILIRQRNAKEYMAYCPQLNSIVRGSDFDDAYFKMEDLVIEHINGLLSAIEIEAEDKGKRSLVL
jgi:hypothetical protein